jgi:hypothetical protein
MPPQSPDMLFPPPEVRQNAPIIISKLAAISVIGMQGYD